jgi:hypothetical protein
MSVRGYFYAVNFREGHTISDIVTVNPDIYYSSLGIQLIVGWGGESFGGENLTVRGSVLPGMNPEEIYVDGTKVIVHVDTVGPTYWENDYPQIGAYNWLSFERALPEGEEASSDDSDPISVTAMLYLL